MSVLQFLAFVSGVAGFGGALAATVSNEWRATSRASSVITATWVLQGLWKNCAGNAIGAVHCRPHHTILQLEGYIQACRALMIAAVCLGFVGSILSLVGMRCTKIGGSDQNKARIACFAGVTFILSGLSSLSACSLYAHRITTEFFDPVLVAQKYEFGTALFVGWGGSVLSILGGCMFCCSIAGSVSKSHSHRSYIHKGNVSHMSSYPRGQTTSGPFRPVPQYSASSRKQHFDKNEYV